MDKKAIHLTINDGDILNVSVRRHTELTIPEFWNILGEGVECLKVLDDTTLGEFDYIFRLLDVEACAVLRDYWIANRQISDDSFQYLVWWIMSQGREFYYKVLVDPAVIPTDTHELWKLNGEEFRYAVGNEF